MSKLLTPIIDFEKLPSEIIEWVKPRLMSDETIQLSIFYDHYNSHNTFSFYILTNQKLLILLTDYDQNIRHHYYVRHEIYFLEDVVEINITSQPYNRGKDEGRVIKFHLGGAYIDSIYLDPQAANEFEKIVLLFLWKKKSHG